MEIAKPRTKMDYHLPLLGTLLLFTSHTHAVFAPQDIINTVNERRIANGLNPLNTHHVMKGNFCLSRKLSPSLSVRP